MGAFLCLFGFLYCDSSKTLAWVGEVPLIYHQKLEKPKEVGVVGTTSLVFLTIS